ncbi:phospho-2-dehydro-3-deoxyheptonate aldolase [Acidobacteria bacterium Mor1]|nr:phospho-2-dehydro-3-deoxyheptonate aldolase [Acidobacteria bacterium Mor1]
MTWSPDSWRQKTVGQDVAYPDAEALARALARISALPPLVTSWEVEALKDKLADAARGEAFLLQGGDCAESFDDCTSDSIAVKLKILLQMSLVLVHGTRKPVIRLGRIAGQYAKPRSADTETRGEVTLPSYRGDLVNRSPFTEEDRTPDPELLLKGYQHAGMTLNFIRALADSGFADLHHPEYWNIDFARPSKYWEQYRQLVENIRDSISFMEAISGSDSRGAQRVDVYTSHEALSLNYELAQTREVPHRRGWYNLTTHFPWIGMRTCQVDGAHVEYCRGIRNPLGIKIGPGMSAEWLGELLEVLHPDNEPGRLVLIHRFGAGKIADQLPKAIEAVRAAGKQVVWCADPMHGNTETTAEGIKTRRFDRILDELEQAFDIHAEMGSVLGGVHIELTGENVTECTGGSSGVEDADLHRAYKSKVDPRLNYEQALEISMRIAARIRGQSAQG